MGERDREREREREIEESGIKDKKRSHQERHDRFFPHLLSTDFSRTRHHEFRTRYHEYYLTVTTAYPSDTPGPPITRAPPTREAVVAAAATAAAAAAAAAAAIAVLLHLMLSLPPCK